MRAEPIGREDVVNGWKSVCPAHAGEPADPEKFFTDTSVMITTFRNKPEMSLAPFRYHRVWGRHRVVRKFIDDSEWPQKRRTAMSTMIRMIQRFHGGW